MVDDTENDTEAVDEGDGIKRGEGGKFVKGHTHRSAARGVKSRKLSRDLKRMLVEKFGPQEGTLKMYIVAAEILADEGEQGKTRLKAAEFLADRVHGKPVTSVDLAAKVEQGSQLERDIRKMSPEQLLELVRLASH